MKRPEDSDQHSGTPEAVESNELTEELLQEAYSRGRAAFQTAIRGSTVVSESRTSAKYLEENCFALSEDLGECVDKHLVTPGQGSVKRVPRSLPNGCTSLLLLDSSREVVTWQQPSALRALFGARETAIRRPMMMSEVGGVPRDSQEEAFRLYYSIPGDLYGTSPGDDRRGNYFIIIVHLPESLSKKIFSGLKKKPEAIRPFLSRFFPELKNFETKIGFDTAQVPEDKRVVVIPPDAPGILTSKESPFTDVITDVNPRYIADVQK